MFYTLVHVYLVYDIILYDIIGSPIFSIIINYKYTVIMLYSQLN